MQGRTYGEVARHLFPLTLAFRGYTGKIKLIITNEKLKCHGARGFLAFPLSCPKSWMDPIIKEGKQQNLMKRHHFRDNFTWTVFFSNLQKGGGGSWLKTFYCFRESSISRRKSIAFSIANLKFFLLGKNSSK